MTHFSDVEAVVASAEERLAEIEQERLALRWSGPRDSPDRQERVQAAIAKVNEAMVPVRAEVGRLIWTPLPAKLEDRLREVSRQLQYQRRQLKKMVVAR